MSSLLVASDDSEGEEIVRRDGRQYNKSHLNPTHPTVGRVQCLLLLSLSLCVSYLGFSYFRLNRKFNELNDSFAEMIVIPRQLRIVEEDIHRLRMEFDLSRDNELSNNTRKTTDYVFDNLRKLEAEVEDLRSIITRTHSAMEDVTRRVATVEGRCLAVCQIEEVREKQRRRQAEKKTTHEIIFKRGGQ